MIDKLDMDNNETNISYCNCRNKECPWMESAIPKM